MRDEKEKRRRRRRKKKAKSSKNSEIDEGFSSSEDKLRLIQKYSSVIELVSFFIIRFQDI